MLWLLAYAALNAVILTRIWRKTRQNDLRFEQLEGDVADLKAEVELLHRRQDSARRNWKFVTTYVNRAAEYLN